MGTIRITYPVPLVSPEDCSNQPTVLASKHILKSEILQASWEEDEYCKPFNEGKMGKTLNNQWRRAFLLTVMNMEAIKPCECDRDCREGLGRPP